MKNLKKRPATSEKFDPSGRSDGRISGIEIGRSNAGSLGMFENEWMYGWITC
jgi:hypothetical protein